MATHWYDQDGKPKYRIIGKNGNERDTNLRDAREHNFVPSVTTIMDMSHKAALENWKIDNALSTCISLARWKGETDSAFAQRAKQEARSKSMEMATIGTMIHNDIECGFKSEPMGEFAEAFHSVMKLLNEHYPDEAWIAEDSFCAKEGYGGKIDLRSLSGIFIDFKTKEDIAEKEAKKMVFDEHGMQLSAYGHGLGHEVPVRASIFIDRNDCKVAKIHIWDLESHQRHLRMFILLLKFWQEKKKYVPEGSTYEQS